jgi:hypothetical protein
MNGHKAFFTLSLTFLNVLKNKCDPISKVHLMSLGNNGKFCSCFRKGTNWQNRNFYCPVFATIHHRPIQTQNARQNSGEAQSGEYISKIGTGQASPLTVQKIGAITPIIGRSTVQL